MKVSNGTVLFCPICGKPPKIIHEYGTYHMAQCKPLFGKPHVVVMTEYAHDLIDAWNLTVENMVEHDEKEGQLKVNRRRGKA